MSHSDASSLCCNAKCAVGSSSGVISRQAANASAPSSGLGPDITTPLRKKAEPSRLETIPSKLLETGRRDGG
jgi:hypothetical protein